MGPTGRTRSGERGAGGASERPSAWEAAVRALALRPRTTHEIRELLLRRDCAPEEVEATLARLARGGYLDDAAYARRYVQSRGPRRALGPARLRRELSVKGIADAEIDAALAELGAEQDPRELARQAARRKLRSLGGLPPAVARRRLAAYLERQGFSVEIILAVCRGAVPGAGQGDTA
jgi:regulatory protein